MADWQPRWEGGGGYGKGGGGSSYRGGGGGGGYRYGKGGGGGYGGKGGGGYHGGGRGSGGSRRLWQPGEADPPSHLSVPLARLLPADGRPHHDGLNCPFSRIGLGKLFDRDRNAYATLCQLVGEKVSFALPPDPHDTLASGTALCSGKSGGFRSISDMEIHASKKGEASKQRAPVWGGDSDASDSDGDGKEAAEAWVHAELLKHLRGTPKLEPAQKRRECEATPSPPKA